MKRVITAFILLIFSLLKGKISRNILDFISKLQSFSEHRKICGDHKYKWERERKLALILTL